MSDAGPIIHCVIQGDLQAAILILRELSVPEEMYSCLKDEIDIAAAILEDIAEELKAINCSLCIIERYPIEMGLVVERIPL